MKLTRRGEQARPVFALKRHLVAVDAGHEDCWRCGIFIVMALTLFAVLRPP